MSLEIFLWPISAANGREPREVYATIASGGASIARSPDTKTFLEAASHLFGTDELAEMWITDSFTGFVKLQGGGVVIELPWDSVAQLGPTIESLATINHLALYAPQAAELGEDAAQPDWARLQSSALRAMDRAYAVAYRGTTRGGLDLGGSFREDDS